MFTPLSLWEKSTLIIIGILSILGSIFISPWFLIVIGLLLVFVFFGWKMVSETKPMLIVILLSILPGMLGRFTTEPRGGTAILLTDILVLFFVFLWALRGFFKKKKVTNHFLLTLLIGFFFVLVLSWIQGLYIVQSTGEIMFNDVLVSFLYLGRFFVYAMLPFMFYGTIKKEVDIHKWIHIFSWIFFGVLLGGFFQRIFFPDFFEFFVKYGWDPHKDRLLGSFFDPNFIGAFIAMNLVLFLSVVLHSKEKRMWYIFLLILGFIALGLTFSRSAYLAFLVGFSLLTILRARWLFVSGVIVLLITIFMVPTVFNRISQGVSLDDSSQKHIESWATAWKLTRMYPVLGVGYNHLGTVQDNLGLLDEWDVHNQYGFENSFLSVSVYSGLIGLFSYLFFWIFYVYYSLRNGFYKAHSRYIQGVSLGILSAVIVALTSSLLINTLFFAFIVIELWGMLGILVFIDKKRKHIF